MITPGRVFVVLLVYGAMFCLIWMYRHSISSDERRTFAFVGLTWAISVFIANYVLFRLGVMSFLPWVNNFMHTFLWIGLCLSWLYLGVRDTQPMWAQFVAFAAFSMIIKVAEQLAFGTWEHPHFFWVFQGNWWYVLGWSLADGLYPIITRTGLRLFRDRVGGLLVT